MFLCYSNSTGKSYWKNCYLSNFLFPSGNLPFNAHNVVLPEKYLKNEDFGSHAQIFKLLVWVPKIVQTYISDEMANCKRTVNENVQLQNTTLKIFQIFSENQ